MDVGNRIHTSRAGEGMSKLITTDEMVELTGTRIKAQQCEVLRKNGIRFTKRHDDRPILSWEAYDRQLSGSGGAEHARRAPDLRAV